MKVSNYLNEKNIKYLPVSLYEYEKDGKKKIGINGAHDYHDFETLDATAIHTRQKKNKTYPLIALNTYDQCILDIDNDENFKQLYPKVSKELEDNCIYYKSRNKRLPHYFIKLINKPETLKHRYDLKCADLLCGQWTWLQRDEMICTEERNIIEIDYNDLVKEKKEIKTTKDISNDILSNFFGRTLPSIPKCW